MKYSQSIFLLLIAVALVSTNMEAKKKVNCRKYVYAPVCRGVAAKRALPSAKSIREPRGEPTVLDLDTPIQWKDKDKGLNEKGMLRIILQKLEPKATDYDNGNMEKYLN